MKSDDDVDYSNLGTYGADFLRDHEREGLLSMTTTTMPHPSLRTALVSVLHRVRARLGALVGLAVAAFTVGPLLWYWRVFPWNLLVTLFIVGAIFAGDPTPVRDSLMWACIIQAIIVAVVSFIWVVATYGDKMG